MYGVIAFESTHDAMSAEKYLKPLLHVVMMPTPRCITASCGISLRFNMDDVQCVKNSQEALGEFHLYSVDDGKCCEI